MEAWTQTCVPLLFHFEPHPNGNGRQLKQMEDTLFDLKAKSAGKLGILASGNMDPNLRAAPPVEILRHTFLAGPGVGRRKPERLGSRAWGQAPEAAAGARQRPVAAGGLEGEALGGQHLASSQKAALGEEKKPRFWSKNREPKRGVG